MTFFRMPYKFYLFADIVFLHTLWSYCNAKFNTSTSIWKYIKKKSPTAYDREVHNSLHHSFSSKG